MPTLELTEEEWSGLVSWLQAGAEYAHLLERAVGGPPILPTTRPAELAGRVYRWCKRCHANTVRGPKTGRCMPCNSEGGRERRRLAKATTDDNASP